MAGGDRFGFGEHRTENAVKIGFVTMAMHNVHLLLVNKLSDAHRGAQIKRPAAPKEMCLTTGFPGSQEEVAAIMVGVFDHPDDGIVSCSFKAPGDFQNNLLGAENADAASK
jgi:hypothetical protein